MTERSNNIDYDLFSSRFSDALKERLEREKFENQCKEVVVLTSLGSAKPIACIRKNEGVTVLFRLLSTRLKGEYVGQLRFSGYQNNVKVMDAQLY